MGNQLNGWFGASTPPEDVQRQSSQPRVRYEVVLPSSGRAWERLYDGDIDTWHAVAARYGMERYAYAYAFGRYGMERYAYDRGMVNRYRDDVCECYFSVSLQPDKQAITIQRYKQCTLQVPIGNSPVLRQLFSEGFELKKQVAAQRGQVLLLVVRKLDEQEYPSKVAFPLVSLDPTHSQGDMAEKIKGGKKGKGVRKGRFSLRGRKGSKHQQGEGDQEGDNGKRKVEARSSNSSVEGEELPTTSHHHHNHNQDSDHNDNDDNNDSELSPGTVRVRGRCLGVVQAPLRDMTIISCQLSPDLSQTAVLFYYMCPVTFAFCYTLHFYSNTSLQHETQAQATADATEFLRQDQRGKNTPHTTTSASTTTTTPTVTSTPHLLRTVKLSREVQPYFVFDPRYRSARIAVANYECRETGINHELVLLSLEDERGGGEARVVRRGKLSLPSLFGNSRFNLLYSKDGELIILQKLTDDRFGVTSFCDIYVFSADQLSLIKYLTASLPGLFHICKVCYEPVFSRCGSYMRILHFFMPSSHPSQAQTVREGAGGGGGDDDEECTMVHIYQLPRTLSLMSQCRRVILQQMASDRCIDPLPLPHKLLDYLKFCPIY